jgi:hypothetical protein
LASLKYPERDQSRAEQDVVALALCGRDVGQFHDGPQPVGNRWGIKPVFPRGDS